MKAVVTEGGARLNAEVAGASQNLPAMSIVTVTLNAVEPLRKTVVSVKAQAWDKIEHIVVDGGSTDGTIEFLESQGPDIAYWRSEPDSGIYDAMNKGIHFAHGRYVFFLNSGDLLVGKVFGPDQDFSRLLPVLRQDFLGRRAFFRLRDIRVGMPYCHQGILFKNLMLKPFDTQLRIAADYQFLLDNLEGAGLSAPGDSRHGYVVFDSTGVSSTRILERDRESARIIRSRFGRWHWIRFWCNQIPKLALRTAVRTIRDLSGRH